MTQAAVLKLNARTAHSPRRQQQVLFMLLFVTAAVVLATTIITCFSASTSRSHRGDAGPTFSETSALLQHHAGSSLSQGLSAVPQPRMILNLLPNSWASFIAAVLPALSSWHEWKHSAHHHVTEKERKARGLPVHPAAARLQSCINSRHCSEPQMSDLSKQNASTLLVQGIWWSTQTTAVPLTIVTQLSTQRLGQLRAQCSSWGGPLSAAVYLPLNLKPLLPAGNSSSSSSRSSVLQNNTSTSHSHGSMLRSSMPIVVRDASGSSISSSQRNLGLLGSLFSRRSLQVAEAPTQRIDSGVSAEQPAATTRSSVQQPDCTSAPSYSSYHLQKVEHAIRAIKRLVKEVESNPGWCQLDVMLLTEQFDDTRAFKALYPVNLLRNYARLQARTPLIAMLDVDMLLGGSTMLQDLQHEASAKRYVQQCIGSRMLVVLPAFQNIIESTNELGLQAADELAHSSKAQLAAAVDDGTAMPFHAKHFPQGHLPTNFSRWFQTSEAYNISYSRRFEPWTISDRRHVPWHDIRLRGYGHNKIVQIAAANASGYAFAVHPTAFIVHRPHHRSPAKVETTADSKTFRRLYHEVVQNNTRLASQGATRRGKRTSSNSLNAMHGIKPVAGFTAATKPATTERLIARRQTVRSTRALALERHRQQPQRDNHQLLQQLTAHTVPAHVLGPADGSSDHLQVAEHTRTGLPGSQLSPAGAKAVQASTAVQAPTQLPGTAALTTTATAVAALDPSSTLKVSADLPPHAQLASSHNLQASSLHPATSMSGVTAPLSGGTWPRSLLMHLGGTHPESGISLRANARLSASAPHAVAAAAAAAATAASRAGGDFSMSSKGNDVTIAKLSLQPTAANHVSQLPGHDTWVTPVHTEAAQVQHAGVMPQDKPLQTGAAGILASKGSNFAVTAPVPAEVQEQLLANSMLRQNMYFVNQQIAEASYVQMAEGQYTPVVDAALEQCLVDLPWWQ